MLPRSRSAGRLGFALDFIMTLDIGVHLGAASDRTGHLLACNRSYFSG